MALKWNLLGPRKGLRGPLGHRGRRGSRELWWVRSRGVCRRSVHGPSVHLRGVRWRGPLC